MENKVEDGNVASVQDEEAEIFLDVEAKMYRLYDSFLNLFALSGILGINACQTKIDPNMINPQGMMMRKIQPRID